MIATLRLFVCAAAIVLAGLILELSHPAWMTELATDMCSLPTIRNYLYEELELGNQLEVHVMSLQARAEAKQRMLKDLIANRLTLIDMATRIHELNSGTSTDQLERLRAVWPGRSSVERYCHQIIQAAQWELVEEPCTAAEVVARLKAELQAAEEAGRFGSAD